MYKFPAEILKAYEALMIPFLLMSYEEGENHLVLVSDGMLKFMGTTREAVAKLSAEEMNNNVFSRIHPDDVGKIKEIASGFVAGSSVYDVVFRAIKYDGYHKIHAVGRWQPLEDGSRIAIIYYADLSEYELIMADNTDNFSHLQNDDFYTDSLTNLPNFNYFNKYSEDRVNAIRVLGAEPVILYYDLDSMQSYNTSYGIQKGDELMMLVASILSQEFSMAQIIRGPEDHFIVLDKYLGKAELVKKVEKINQRIKSEAYGNTTGAHVGICVLKKHTLAKEGLDYAKRAHKLLGQNLNICYKFYSAKDNYDFLNQRYIIENFDRAIKHNDIKVYYQGLMRVETGKLYGFECLARWIDSERGTIMPSDFIPALEKYHLMHDLDLFMFEQVCREIIIRHEGGLELVPVSINFSRQDFDYIDVVGELNRIYDKYELKKYGVKKSNFMVEITEQDMATATDAFNKQLKDIRKSGYKLWIDDFGSGYSSLNVFSSIDIDLIKFDMDLLRHLDDNNSANRVLISALVGVARKLGIHTLCEGLETQEQLAFLKNCECELAQGYLYHKPMSLDDILASYRKEKYVVPFETTEERNAKDDAWNNGEEE